jgi:foldase protein PrsA
MENEKIAEDQGDVVATTTKEIQVTIKKSQLVLFAICAGIVLVLGALFFSKGFFVAAIVNGSPISRLSVVQELEKQGGKQALESMITEKLIKKELEKNNIVVESSAVDTKIKEIESQVIAQGGTLEGALIEQGMTIEELKEQLQTQLKLEKVVAEKVVVTDAEVDSYITTNDITPSEEVKVQVKEQIRQQKFQAEAQKWIADITAKANIKYYVTY